MTDLVEDLRTIADHDNTIEKPIAGLLRLAANEIERMQDIIANLRQIAGNASIDASPTYRRIRKDSQLLQSNPNVQVPHGS